jgi:hypothetical protein
LHIYEDLFGDYCAHAGYYGFGGSGTCYATMTNGISTLGHSEVNISFDWLCRGNTAITPSFGFVEFSINNGASWTQMTNPINRYSGQATWTTVTISSSNYPTIANQANLRLRFGWTSSGYGQNPAFAIDNISITGGQPIVCENTAGVLNVDKNNICSGTSTNLNLTDYVGELQWQKSTNNINWENINDAFTNQYVTEALSQNTYYKVLSKQDVCPDLSSNVVMVEVIANVVSEITLEEISPVCVGSEISFVQNAINQGANPQYLWYVNEQFIVSNENFSSTTLNSGDEVYCILLPDTLCKANDSIASNIIEINLFDIPEVLLNFEQKICYGDNLIELDGGFPEGGTYSGEGVQNNTFDSALEPGIYTITYTYIDDNECLGTANAELTLNDIPDVQLNLEQKICQGDNFIDLVGGFPEGGTYSGEGVLNNTFDTTLEPGIYTITYSYSDDNECSGSASAELEIEICVSIEQSFQKSDLTLHPNPVKDILRISGFSKQAQLRIVGVKGALILDKMIQPSEMVSTSDFPSGLYIYQLNVDDKLYTGKFVKE